MRSSLYSFGISVLLYTLSSLAQAQSQLEVGKRIYTRWCVDCHGAGEGFAGLGLTGTAALEAKYNGSLPALLHERRDLAPEFVVHIVRRGVSLMPFFRKTEINNTELEALAAYLTRNNKAAQDAGRN